MPNGPKSDAARERAVTALLSCATIKQAARKAGVGLRTLTRWLSDDRQFQQLLARARQRALELAVGRLAKSTANAVTTLAKASKDGDVKAAGMVIDRALKGVELADVLARVERLEEQARLREAR
jgi:hypothetical protein